jgi:two-component system sensor histidine kinase YesM
MTANTERLISQTNSSLEDYLVSMRRLSDALYYNAIREVDCLQGY